MQVFADESCTHYANGSQPIVYARFNRDISFGEAFQWGNPQSETITSVSGPSTQIPVDPYWVYWETDWLSTDYFEPFTQGQVVQLLNTQPELIPDPSLYVIFYEDGRAEVAP